MGLIDPKASAVVGLIANLTDVQLKEAKAYFEEKGIEVEETWEVIVKYNGDIKAVAQAVGGSVQIISEKFAAIRLPISSTKTLLNYTQVEYVESDKSYVYNIAESMKAACISTVRRDSVYGLTGRGVLLGIIDSGINYSHPDFRNEDGTTRIAYIWDQTIEGAPPVGFDRGTQYTREQINEALSKPTLSQQLAVVPSEDSLGHGTHVASIAGGNGRSSRGQYIGAAPDAEFIIVKLGKSGRSVIVRTIEIMLGVKYVLEKAEELQKPIAINLSLGMNEGSHDGQSLIEQYLDDMSQKWKNNIVVGAGNEGSARAHTEGTVSQGGSEEILLQIGPNKKGYNLVVWQSFIDNFEFEIIGPAGGKTPRISYAQGPRTYIVDNTRVYTSFAGPSPLNGDIEFAMYFIGIDENPITSGIWTIRLYGVDVIDGNYNAWGEIKASAGEQAFLLNAVVDTTITTPSTASKVISVGAYDHVTNQIAVFSGVGFGRGGSVAKPDLVAPGVNITAAGSIGGYRTLSGTSMATPHVTGGVALLMEWGITRRRNLFLYGENLKAYLLRGANKDIVGITYPDPRWGYGKLCIRDSLEILVRQQIL